MDIKIQAINFEISDRLYNFVQKKAARIARRFPNLTDIDVNLTVERPESPVNKQAVVRLIEPRKSDKVATKTADTFEEAVDQCFAALEPQLEKAKEKPIS